MDFSNLSLVAPKSIDAQWSLSDKLGAIRVRSSLGRSKYRVDPGLYKLGNAGKEDAVFVSANYKLSFDILRRSLKGMNAWILVLQTHGINVWCAAGKGSFGTDELLRQINESGLKTYVGHKRLIVPQLGAPGVSAHKVKKASGYTVKFGPVRAEDIKAYVFAGYKKDEAATRVQFNFRDRILLSPVEVVNSLKYLLIALAFVALLSGLHPGGYSFPLILKEAPMAWAYLLLAYFSGAVLGPALLPWLPFRHFGGKGLVAGFLTYAGLVSLTGVELSTSAYMGWGLISGAIASFLLMNFTGASTYTSLSGVRKEMKFFVPLQLLLTLTGLALVVISKLVDHG